MKTAELRAKSKEELKDLVLSLKKEQFNMRFQQSTGALDNALRFREVKKTIARVKTLINEVPGSVKPKAEKAAKAAPAKKKTAKAKKED